MLSDRFDTALRYACGLHRKQLRKGTKIPYISHLLAVSSLVIEQGAGEEVAIAAVLHDAVEDCGGAARLEDIRSRFGDTVAAIVEGCSDSLTVDPEAKAPWRERKEAYLAELPTKPPAVRLVSLCDKLHNARCIVSDCRVHGEGLWERFTGGRDGTLWYYRQLVDIYHRTGMDGPLLHEFERTVEQMEYVAATGGRS